MIVPNEISLSQIDAWLRAVVINESGCWLYQGRLDRGYAVTNLRGGGRRASHHLHRDIYCCVYGVPAAKDSTGNDLELDHICQTKNCINFNHLELVTHGENLHRELARNTHCKRGHRYTEANTGLNSSSGHRYCRDCKKIYAKRYRTKLNKIRTQLNRVGQPLPHR